MYIYLFQVILRQLLDGMVLQLFTCGLQILPMYVSVLEPNVFCDARCQHTQSFKKVAT
jgi:hypothetical protein